MKIGIAVLCHERPECLELCLDSLFKINLYDYDVTFLLIDDGSQDKKVAEIINKQRLQKYNIVRLFCSKGHNSWGAAFNRAMNELLTIDDFGVVGTCDSDALFHPEWLDKSIKVMIWAKKNHNRHVLGPFSSFNSSDVEFHDWLGVFESPFGKYVVKRRMGALNYLYFKDDFLKLGFFEEDKNDETLMTERFRKLRVRNFCLFDSYIDHIGKRESILDKWRPIPVAENAVYGLNIPSSDWGCDIERINPVGYIKTHKRQIDLLCDSRSEMELDVIIPALESDLDVLKLSVEGVRKNLRHPICSIKIVSPSSERIKKFCLENKCEYFFENNALSLKKTDITYRVGKWNRSGWLFQQFLKWSEIIPDTENYLVLDADTVFVRPVVFENNRRNIFLLSDEKNSAYLRCYERLFGYVPKASLSFVAHCMLINKTKLRILKNEIESKFSLKWYQAIMNSIDYSEISGFSEYETYGNWMLENYPEETDLLYWSNYSTSRINIDYQTLVKKYSSEYCSVSFHYHESRFKEAKQQFERFLRKIERN
ncbi:MAG: DUF6492 family protein [Negativicutes bacterium]